ncbi:MAG: phosphotyrosine protein phosphatase [Gammaproteobacteria bacterium]|nr:phosphotyrosine protein phosphatase [Gammaproteobacteria bacterium]MCP5196499.1 phosphotyrosine protein phosphatase [Gammaproteobacteria bacterium]
MQTLLHTNYGTLRGWVRYLLGQVEGVVGPQGRYRQLIPWDISRLVFVCLGNINRSAFAQAVARAAGGHCASVGLSTTTGVPATDLARQVSAELGFFLDAHRATNFTDFEVLPGDLFIVMELRHAHRLVAHGIPPQQIILLGHWARPVRYHIHDPQTLSAEYFRSCFAIILPAIKYLLEELRRGNSPCVHR